MVLVLKGLPIMWLIYTHTFNDNVAILQKYSLIMVTENK